MYHTVTSATAPFTLARISRAIGSRLGLDLPLLTHTEPHYVRIPRHLPQQEDDALQRTFHVARDPYTYRLQLQHFIPGLQHLGPLLLHNGNRFIAYEDLDSDDESVVHQIPPGNSLLRPRPPMAALRPPLPPVGQLMDPLQLYYWYWSTGRNEDDSDEDDHWYALYPQVYSRQSHFQFPRRPL